MYVWISVTILDLQLILSIDHAAQDQNGAAKVCPLSKLKIEEI